MHRAGLFQRWRLDQGVFLEKSEQMFDEIFFSKCKQNKMEGLKAEVCKVQTENNTQVLHGSCWITG